MKASVIDEPNNDFQYSYSGTCLFDYILKNEKFNPTIKSVAMVEKLIFQNKEFDSKTVLYKKLPTGMQYPMFNYILDILEKQNKITFEKDGSFFWTGPANETLQNSLKQATEY